MEHSEVLNDALSKVQELLSNGGDDSPFADSAFCGYVKTIVGNSESSKGLLAVVVTLLTHKVVCPQQDIRRHQASMPNGFSGRTIDTKFVTPFLQHHDFPAMAQSGWLTRSLEQPHPYDLSYPGRITPNELKNAFLKLLDAIELGKVDAYSVLVTLIRELVLQRDACNVEIAKPHVLSIANIIKILELHFTARYTGSGASRLPVLAIYAAYQCMMEQVARYAGKRLLNLESHNSADRRSGRIGDIDVVGEKGDAFEGVEVKHGIKITSQLIHESYEKFKTTMVDRYYLLSTANMDSADWNAVNVEIEQIAKIHGCQVVVNGVYSTLKYYLRLLTNTAEFVDRYVELMKADESVKYQHKVKWNELVANGI